MKGFTFNEARKIGEITARLERIESPVLRLQAILQFSQIVDILDLGDTNMEGDNRVVQGYEKPPGFGDFN